MTKKILLSTLFVVIMAFSASAKTKLEDDMRLFLTWFDGRFDNFAQTVEEKDSKAEFPHERIHSIFKRVDLPQIGEYVFYVQQFMDGDETKIYRQRLYVFTISKAEKAIELKINTFADEKAVMNAHLDPAKLRGLTADKLDAPKGCEVYWRLNATRDKFEGSMKPGACRVVSKRSGKTLIISDDLFLTKDEIWINDQARDEQGNYVFGNRSNTHHKLRRARMFEGWTAVLKDGSTEMRGEDLPADSWDGKRNLTIHDQGGRVAINERFSAELSQLAYRNGTRVLKLGVVENATGKTVAYTWANEDATRIGINLRWIQAGFTVKQ
ncbi:MAG TPA: chromophore lyase CpcT/CpeT [Pyrinomonadaceae bacterium]|nr:chromophore lyase CpcT/CpeT [Pyrinomonadaceae bacterium]